MAHGRRDSVPLQSVYSMATEYFMIARVVQVAAELGLFTHLAGKSLSAAELAETLEVDGQGLQLLLNACVALDLMECHGEVYSVSKAAYDAMGGEASYSLEPVLAGASGVYEDWVKLNESVRTGKATALPSHDKDQEQVRNYVLSMHAASNAQAKMLAGSLPLPQRGRLIDVGGGAGTYALAFCRRNPQLRATVLDLPVVAAVAEEVIQASGLSDRIDVRAGDYNKDSIPINSEVVLLINILHQENPAQAATLIRKAASALRKKGMLVVLDVLADDRNRDRLHLALGSLNQFIHHQGAGYHSVDEVKKWMQDAACDCVTARPLPSGDTTLLIGEKQ